MDSFNASASGEADTGILLVFASAFTREANLSIPRVILLTLKPTKGTPETATDWIIDSGAFYHMTYNQFAFSDMRTLTIPLNVKIANGAEYPAVSIGRIHIHLTNNSLLTLVDCLYIPSFNVSLLSVDALSDANFDVRFNAQDHTC